MPDPLLSLFAGGNIFGQPWQPQMPGLNLSGIPGMGGMGGMGLGILMQPLLMQFAQSHGMMGLQFMGSQNLFDTLQAQQMFADRNAAMVQAAQADRLQFINMARGATTMMGGQFTQGHFDAANRLSGVMAQMSPFLATMMPDFYDRMFGQRGSAAVMAGQIFQGGRFAADPITGLPGMSAESTGFIARNLYDQLYRTDDDMRKMRGISAGQVGQMYDELSRRGFLGSARGRGELSGEDVGFLGEDNATRAREVTHLRDKMQNLAGTVRAMKDIFGDAGQPDAPIPMIINALEAITQGGLAQMSPAKMEATVRSAQQAMRMASVGLGGFMQLGAQGAGLADQMGLNRQFGGTATTHALYFAAAFGEGGTSGQFGALGKDAAMSLDQQLMMSAARSPLAQSMSAVMAMRDLYGNNPQFANSALAQVAADIQAGKQTTPLSYAQLMSMAQGAGISGSDASAILDSPNALQVYTNQFGIAAQVRRQQFNVDIAPMLGNLFGHQLSANGITNPNVATALAQAFATAGIHRLDPNQRAAALVDAIDPALIGGNRGQILGAVNSGLLRLDEVIATTPHLRAYGNTVGLSQMMDQATLNRQSALAEIGRNRGAIMSGLAGLGQGGFMRNFADFLMTNKDADVGKFLASVFGGGVTFDQANAALAPVLRDMAPIMNELGTATGARREQLQSQLSGLIGMAGPTLDKLMAQNPEIRKMLEMSKAGSDEAILDVLGASGMPKGGIDAMKKAMAGATPEQRLRLMQAAEAVITGGPFEDKADINALLSLDKTGDVKSTIQHFFGEKGVRATGMGPQEVSFAPGSSLEIKGTVTLDKEGTMRLQGVGTPANRGSVRT